MAFGFLHHLHLINLLVICFKRKKLLVTLFANSSRVLRISISWIAFGYYATADSVRKSSRCISPSPQMPDTFPVSSITKCYGRWIGWWNFHFHFSLRRHHVKSWYCRERCRCVVSAWLICRRITKLVSGLCFQVLNIQAWGAPWTKLGEQIWIVRGSRYFEK